MGKYQPGRGTWPTPQNGKWPYLKYRLGKYIPLPLPPPYLSNTLTNLCMALFISHCIFCSLFLYFCTEFLWQYNAMHKFVRALDNPPLIQEQTSQVSRFWGQSHALTMRHKNLTVNRFTSWWNTLFFKLFCFEKLIFMRQLCRNPQFSGIFISIHHIWSSCWQDKCQISYHYQFVAFKYVSNTMSKWWEMKIHQAKTKFKTEWEASYPAKHILSNPFHFYVFPTPGFSSFWCRR